MMSNPFRVLGLQSPRAATTIISAQDVLRAWRKLALENHPDKTGSTGEKMQALNEAKDQCLEQIVMRDFTLSERDYALHICRILDRQMARDGITGIHMENNSGASIVRIKLREFYWKRGVDAMEWILMCGMGQAAFNQEVEDEIPILCRYYHEFIGKDSWTKEEHTIMTVLDKYDQLKAKGYGNFAHRLKRREPSE